MDVPALRVRPMKHFAEYPNEPLRSASKTPDAPK